MRLGAILLIAVPSIAVGQSSDLGPVADRLRAVDEGISRLRRGRRAAPVLPDSRLRHGEPGNRNADHGSNHLQSGSVAKQFTAASTLLLMSDGKLRLDDRVQKYLPELPIRHPAHDPPPALPHERASRVEQSRGRGRLGAREPVSTQDELLDAVFSQKEVNYPVGDHYSYTNSGFGLLVTIIERVSGMPFTQFTSQRLFKPWA